MSKIPHVIPYQGSKRKIAEAILSHVDFAVDTLYEPFVGSGAITLASAAKGLARSYVVSDKLTPLSELWEMIVSSPDALIREYERIWNEQLDDPAEHFKKIRDEFNKTKSAPALLYLIARCVKNAIRFNANGDFNQGADHRRLGTKPDKLRREVELMSKLLRGKILVRSGDFREAIATAGPNDLVYMDPPWQGTSGKRDPRYAFLLDIDDLVEELGSLNNRNVPYLLSFDGSCGDKSYGTELPNDLGLKRVGIDAGRSSQATLLGRDDRTIESLYLSPALLQKTKRNSDKEIERQLDLLAELAA